MPPTIFDICGTPNGSDIGTWLDAIYHSPLLDVRDHAPSDGSKAFTAPHASDLDASCRRALSNGRPAASLGLGTGNHDALNTGRGQPNHGAR